MTGDNIEAGIKRDWLDGRWTSSLALYQITKNDVLTGDPEHQNFSIQTGQTKTVGWEADIQGELLPGLDLVANYAFTDSWISDDTRGEIIGNETPGTIKHIANGWLSYRHPEGTLKGAGASAGLQYQADRYNWYSFDGGESRVPDDQLRVDGGLSWQGDKLGVAFNVNNVFDEYIYDGTLYTFAAKPYYIWNSEPGRNYRLSLSYRFK